MMILQYSCFLISAIRMRALLPSSGKTRNIFSTLLHPRMQIIIQVGVDIQVSSILMIEYSKYYPVPCRWVHRGEYKYKFTNLTSAPDGSG